MAKVGFAGSQLVLDDTNAVMFAGEILLQLNQGDEFVYATGTVNMPTLSSFGGGISQQTASMPTISGSFTVEIVVLADLTAPSASLDGYTGATGNLSPETPTISASGRETELTGGNLTAITPTVSGHGGGYANLSGKSPSVSGQASADIWGKASLIFKKPVVTGSMTLDVAMVGNLVAAMPSARGYGGAIAALRGTLPRVSASAEADVLARGVLVAAKPVVSGSGYTDTVGHGNLIAPSPVSLYGLGNLVAMRPMVSGSMSVEEARTLIAYAMNISNGAMTRYTGYDFDYIVRFRGKHYGFSAAGCFLLDGDNDNGAAIDAFAEISPSDFGVRQEKRAPYAYVGSEGSEHVVVTATVDERKSVNVRTAMAGRNKRAKMPRGLKGVYWGFRLSNINGGPLHVDGLDVVPEVVRRKV